MAPSSRVVNDEITNFLDYLVTSELALHINPVTYDPRHVSWRPFSPGAAFLEERGAPSLSEYRSWLGAGHYSALLFDWSLLQLTYDFAGHDLVSHRLAWVPCPFVIESSFLEIGSFLDVVDAYTDGPATDVVLNTAVRFDFDAARAAPNHPAAHLTINSAECRIACAAPLRLGHFVDFIFRNFYPDMWLAHPYLDGLSRAPLSPHTVTEDEAARLHVTWKR